MNKDIVLQNLLRKIFLKYGAIYQCNKLSSVTNDVYHLLTFSGNFVLKIKTERELCDNLDVDLTLLGASKFYRGVLETYKLKNNTFAFLLEYVDGILLRDIFINKSTFPINIYNQINLFFKELSLIKTARFGTVDKKLIGTESSWSLFLQSKITSYKEVINKNSSMSDGMIPFSSIYEIASGIACNDPVLVPADINLTNFVINEYKNLKVIDVGSYISGDRLLPYGLLVGHVWGSPISEFIISKNKSSRKELLFYSLIEMLAILSFTYKFYPNLGNTVKPFGNKYTCLNIIKKIFKNYPKY